MSASTAKICPKSATGPGRTKLGILVGARLAFALLCSLFNCFCAKPNSRGCRKPRQRSVLRTKMQAKEHCAFLASPCPKDISCRGFLQPRLFLCGLAGRSPGGMKGMHGQGREGDGSAFGICGQSGVSGGRKEALGQRRLAFVAEHLQRRAVQQQAHLDAASCFRRKRNMPPQAA